MPCFVPMHDLSMHDSSTHDPSMHDSSTHDPAPRHPTRAVYHALLLWPCQSGADWCLESDAAIYFGLQVLNSSIVEAINSAAVPWGLQCLRCEIRDISLPDKVVEDMQRQVSAERRKRVRWLAKNGPGADRFHPPHEPPHPRARPPTPRRPIPAAAVPTTAAAALARLVRLQDRPPPSPRSHPHARGLVWCACNAPSPTGGSRGWPGADYYYYYYFIYFAGEHPGVGG